MLHGSQNKRTQINSYETLKKSISKEITANSEHPMHVIQKGAKCELFLKFATLRILATDA